MEILINYYKNKIKSIKNIKINKDVITIELIPNFIGFTLEEFNLFKIFLEKIEKSKKTLKLNYKVFINQNKKNIN